MTKMLLKPLMLPMLVLMLLIMLLVMLVLKTLMLILWAKAVTPGITHFRAYHCPSNGHFVLLAMGSFGHSMYVLLIMKIASPKLTQTLSSSGFSSNWLCSGDIVETMDSQIRFIVIVFKYLLQTKVLQNVFLFVFMVFIGRPSFDWLSARGPLHPQLPKPSSCGDT